MKYYFVTYKWTRESIGKWTTSNTVMDKHPVNWLKEMIDNYDDVYRIEFYSEINKEQYDLIYGWID